MAADAALRHGAVTLIPWPASEPFVVGRLRHEGQACLLIPRPAVAPGAIRYWPPSDVGRLPAESQGVGTVVAFSLAALQTHGQMVALEGGTSDRLHPALLRSQVVPLLRPQQRFVGQTLSSAVDLIHRADGFGGAASLSSLALDALVLRSLALLLLPDPAQPAARANGITLHEAVDQAMARMLAHLDRAISLADLEREIGYSRRSLQLGFRQRVGCGPIQWLRRQRLSLAHERITAMAGRLRRGDCTLTAVARQCGYGNLASFSRDFSSLYGYPPSQLLRQA